jgi:hypothetical protein
MGRILRENGRKLYPGANPGVDQFYVGVYDPVSFLSGFIDPNNGIYAPFNENKPTYVGDSTDDYVNNSQPDAGPPVLTNGNIVALGNGGPNWVGITNDLEGNNAAYFSYGDIPIGAPPMPFLPYVGAIGEFEGNTTEAYMGVNPGEAYLTLGNATTSGTPPSIYLSSGNDVDPAYISTTGTVSYGTGLRVPEPALAGSVSMVGGTVVGAFKKKNVTAAGCTSNSRIFLTYSGQDAPGYLSAEDRSNGSFKIVSSSTIDVGQVQYFIVN